MGIFDDIKKALGLGPKDNAQPSPKPPTEVPVEAPAQAQQSASRPNKNAVWRQIGLQVEFEKHISEVIAEYRQHNEYFYNIKVSLLTHYQEVAALWDDKKRVDFVVDSCAVIRDIVNVPGHYSSNDPRRQIQAMRQAYIEKFMRTKWKLDDEDIARIFEAFCSTETQQPAFRPREIKFEFWPINAFVNQIVAQDPDLAVTEEKKAIVRLVKAKIEDDQVYFGAKDRAKMLEKLNGVLEGKNPSRIIQFTGDDALGKHANAMIAALPEAEKTLWYPLIGLAQTAGGSKPTVKFLNEAKAGFQAIGEDKFKQVLLDWFAFTTAHKESMTQQSYTYAGHTRIYNAITFLTEVNLETLKGFVWMCAHFHDSATLQSVAKLAERCFKKIPDKGPTAPALGNGCLFVLFKSVGLEGIGHLSRLKLKVKHSSTLSMIDKYLVQAAQQQGVTMEEIEDMAVDDLGLVNGKRKWKFDQYDFELEVVGPGKTVQSWIKPDGSPQKSEPAYVKENHAAELKKLKAWVKQVEQASTTQRDRIDRLFRSNRTMTWEYFQTYYFEHGLMGFLAKKILWRFAADAKVVTAIWSGNGWVDAANELVAIPTNATVSLCHPAIASVAEIAAWRAYLIQNQVLQPLKQAFREVYLLTEAEINTGTYSNRMAAHILKQHQFNSLAKVRGWKYALLGSFDGGTNPVASLNLPAFDLTAEYWLNDLGPDVWLNETGIFTYMATDQVRFISNTSRATLELIDIAPIAFSEVLRDVDLFVGVASVGNDPTWQDSSGLPAYNQYWQTYSFGEVSESGKMRKEILAGLIPRLKIKNVASLKGNFVIVQGKLRTYKIHVGSGNILMEPNDQYLCIVPDSRAKIKADSNQVFLPFEGDSVLSIILSKAFLLAEDDKITDRSITSQILRQ